MKSLGEPRIVDRSTSLCRWDLRLFCPQSFCQTSCITLQVSNGSLFRTRAPGALVCLLAEGRAGAVARVGREANPPPFRGRRRSHELVNRFEHDLKLFGVLAELPLVLVELAGQVFMGGQDFTQPDKRPHDGNVDFDRARAV